MLLGIRELAKEGWRWVGFLGKLNMDAAWNKRVSQGGLAVGWLPWQAQYGRCLE